MAKLKDLAEQAGEIAPTEGQSIKRAIQDATGIYDGRSDWSTPYTDDQITKAVALYKLYGSYAQASRETGIPSNTISNWINGRTEVLSKIGNFSKKLDEAYNALIDNSVFLMSEAQKVIYEKLPQSSAAQAATIYGILADKARYMAEGSRAGASTSLHFDLAGLSGDEQGKLLDRVFQRQQQRQEEQEAIDAEFAPVEVEEEQEDQDTGRPGRKKTTSAANTASTDFDNKQEYKRQKRIRSAQQREQRELQKLQKLK